MGDRTTHRTLSPKRTPFQNGIAEYSVAKRCLEKDGKATHILCDCEAIAYLRLRHLGQYFMDQGNYEDVPVSKILHLIRSAGRQRQFVHMATVSLRVMSVILTSEHGRQREMKNARVP
jgi:hypothetical protein